MMTECDAPPETSAKIHRVKEIHLWNLLKQLLDQPVQALAVIRLHVNEFDTDPVRVRIAHHSSGLDSSQSGSNLQAHGISDDQTLVGFQKGSAQGDASDACRAASCTHNRGWQRRLQ